MNLPLESTPGDECALCIRGGIEPVEVCGRAIGVDEDWLCERTGNWCTMGFIGILGSLYRSVGAGLDGIESYFSSTSRGGG